MLRILFLVFSLNCLAQSEIYNVKKILKVEITSSINPATFSYLKEAYRKALSQDFQMVLIKMNTPGGLLSSTRDILTLIGENSIPSIVWVGPEGASATSAGAIIAAGAHILLMAKGTSIGSATPVDMTGELKTDQRKKAINSLVGLVQGLAESRGRNPEAFEKMVKDAITFSAINAMRLGLIDGIVERESEVTQVINNRLIKNQGISLNLIANNPEVVPFQMDLGQSLLNILADPTLAYIFFLIGVALIYLEFQAPGGYLAGSIGTTFLILAALGFQVLPLNFGAVGLIILSFILFFMEIYLVSFGLLALAGIASLIIGSLFLFRTDNAYLEISRTVIYSSVFSISAFIGLISAYIYWDRKQHKLRENFFSKVGKQVIVTEVLVSHEPGWYYYHVKLSGEIWKAKSKSIYNLGDSCKVQKEAREDMCLFIGE